MSLPFGVSEAPRIFTAVLRRLACKLRLAGARSIFYLDDILVIGRSRAECSRFAKYLLALLTDLGFLVSWEKSVVAPSQKMEFLGFLVDSSDFVFRLPNKKRRLFKHRVQRLKNAALQGRLISLRALSAVIGSLTSLSLAYTQTRESLRWLRRDLRVASRQARSFSQPVSLSPAAMKELDTWLQVLASDLLCRPIRIDAPTITMASDACPQGWGAIHPSSGLYTFGHWRAVERDEHNNLLELGAMILGVCALTPLAHAHPFNLIRVRFAVRSSNSPDTTHFTISISSSNIIILAMGPNASLGADRLREKFLLLIRMDAFLRSDCCSGLFRSHFTIVVSESPGLTRLQFQVRRERRYDWCF